MALKDKGKIKCKLDEIILKITIGRECKPT
jgi:hypothetical protein